MPRKAHKMTIFTPEMRAKALATREANAVAELQNQKDNTRLVDGYIIRPTLSRGIGNEYVGWEVIPPNDVHGEQIGSIWYFADEAQAIASVPRHKARYAKRVA
jgi:hypothetical protein